MSTTSIRRRNRHHHACGPYERAARQALQVRFEAYEDEKRTVLLDRLTQEICVAARQRVGMRAIGARHFAGGISGQTRQPAPIEKLMLACDR